MSATELWLGRAGTLLIAALLIGLFWRRRARLWYAFPALLFVVLTHDVLVTFWPAQFYRGAVWRTKESTLILVRLAMVVELAFRVFRGFPGAMATARGVLIVILAGTFVAVTALPTQQGGYVRFVGELMPRILNGTVWLFTALAVLILWYRLPIHWFQKSILLSYVPYLLVFTVAVNVLGNQGWQRAAWVNQLSAWAWDLLVLFWTVTAWRGDARRTARSSSGPDDGA
jgi:hypothetical protein